MLAPIIVFAYKRKKHLQEVLNGLSRNVLASESELYIFVDGPKVDEDETAVKEVTDYVKGYSKEHTFKSVKTEISKHNKGLSQSIKEGVSKVITKHGKVIVLEDDAVPSKYFLKFMNESLEEHQNNKHIGHIGAYRIPINLPSSLTDDCFLMTRGSSAGWATWKSTWDKVDWNVKDYGKFKFNFFKRYRFNKSGNDKAITLDNTVRGKIDSWAIIFSYNMFKLDMYALLPRHILIENIGHDGSGIHGGNSDKFTVYETNLDRPLNVKDPKFYKSIEKAYYNFFKRSVLKRIIKYVLMVFDRKNVLRNGSISDETTN